MKLTLTEQDRPKVVVIKTFLCGIALTIGGHHVLAYANRTETARPSIILAHPDAQQPFFNREPQKPLQFDLRSEWDKQNDLYEHTLQTRP